MSSKDELACTYAALILHDDGLEITGAKISSLCSAAGLKVEGYWPTLFAKFLDGKDVGSLLSNVGSAGAAPAGGATGGGGGGGAKKEEEKEEEKQDEEEEEEDDDMGFGLFD